MVVCGGGKGTALVTLSIKCLGDLLLFRNESKHIVTSTGYPPHNLSKSQSPVNIENPCLAGDDPKKKGGKGGFKTLSLTLPHNHTAHKHLNRPDPFQGHLPLPRRLPQPQLMPQLLFANSVRVVDLVAQDQEGHLGELFHREQGVELQLRFLEPFMVLGVDEEDDPADLGEVVAP